MAFDRGFDTIVMLQTQAERLFSSALQQNPWVPENGKRAMVEWIEGLKQGRDEYKRVIDESFDRFGSSCSPQI